jgi:hypothetical protein
MGKEVTMEIATGILLAATLVSAVKNLYELTFMIDDDPAKQRKLKCRTSEFNRNSKARHYFLTIEGGRVVGMEPVD